MKGVSFVQHNKLPNVAGRIRYISSEEEQEYLYAVYDTAPEGFWQDLARENQMDFKKSGTTGRCIEARELIIALPPIYFKYGPPHEELLRYFTDNFKEKYNVECTSALHHNKTRTNYHIHLIFSERRLLDEPEIKTARRNMYYDPYGKHLRTAKEAKDDKGNLLPGYRMVPKGEAYETHIFAKKDPDFKGREFTNEVKEFITDLINKPLRDGHKLMTFPKNGPYMPTKKIGKNNPKAAEIKEQNKYKDEWNQQIYAAELMGVPKESLKEVKSELITGPVRESVKGSDGKKDLAAFKDILVKAVKTIIMMVRESKRMDRATLKKAWGPSIKEFIKICAERGRNIKILGKECNIER